MVNLNLMEKNTMNKIQDKLIDLLDDGYGINQAMDKLGLKQDDIVALMEENLNLNKKLKKRFAGTEWIDKVEFKGKAVVLADSDTPEMAALKAEAVELGIEFNPRIGYDTLKKRVDEWKATHATETTPETPAE